MRPELDKIELIEKYLRDELHGEELTHFENELQSNAELKAEVEMQRYLMAGVENTGLRKTLNHIHNNLYDNPISYFLKSYSRYLIGGGLIVISAVALFFVYHKSGSNTGLTESNSDNKTLIEMLADKNTYADEQIGVGDAKNNKTIFKSDSYLPAINPFKSFFAKDIIASKYFMLYADRDTQITGICGTKIKIHSGTFEYKNGMAITRQFKLGIKEAYKCSEMIWYDLPKESDYRETTGGILFEVDDSIRIASGKFIDVNFKNRPVHYDPYDSVPVKQKELIYYKVFNDLPERRIILLPSVVLDYDIIYTRKSADPLMNERIESLLLPEYDSTFTSTTQFHYRIEGCQLYGKGIELLDIYLNNTHLKLWEADSLVVQYMVKRSQEDCANFNYYMKAAEYFRWLKSQKLGKPRRVPQLDYRNYRKGQFYNKLTDHALEKYLTGAGLTDVESKELIDYFKKMFFFKKMLYRTYKFTGKGGDSTLEYYYEAEGSFIGFDKTICAGQKMQTDKYVYKTNDNLGSATELNYFMPVNKLGWVNSERFINYKKTSSLKVLLTNADSSVFSKVYIVFKDVSSVMGGKWTKSNFNYFEKIPTGIKAYIVGISYSNDNLYFAMKEIVTGQSVEETLDLKLTDENTLKKELSHLD
ncbi:MAG: hypothetical protein K2X86_12750 [Cytophagaceae bacterium]|nr:hypothetical protein [Cytophagaceae bacterium]